MPKAPDNLAHVDRLRALKNDYQQQERFMAAALRDLQAQLDRGQTTSFGTVENDIDADDLREETAELSIDLSHIRMAIVGAAEELANHADDHICRVTYRRLGA